MNVRGFEAGFRADDIRNSMRQSFLQSIETGVMKAVTSTDFETDTATRQILKNLPAQVWVELHKIWMLVGEQRKAQGSKFWYQRRERKRE